MVKNFYLLEIIAKNKIKVKVNVFSRVVDFSIGVILHYLKDLKLNKIIVLSKKIGMIVTS